MSDFILHKVPFFNGGMLNHADAQEILDHHNNARREVGVPPLEWSTKLADYAQNWAGHLSVNYNCKLKHSECIDKDGHKLGENLWWGSSSSFYKPIDASIGWLNEKKDYLYQAFGNQTNKPIGHYTQMVWKNTTEMGVGVAYCPSGGMIIVANYNPPGNWLGQYPY
jgi:uncharacterized protein YkwD